MNLMRSIQLGAVASLLAGAVLVSAARSEATCVTKTQDNITWTCNNGVTTTQIQHTRPNNSPYYTISGGSAYLALGCIGGRGFTFPTHTGIWDYTQGGPGLPAGQFSCQGSVVGAYSKCGDTADCGNFTP